MGEEKIELMVDGGKAVSTPQLAQKLGPLKINIAEVLKKVNDKTKDMEGMQVPVKLFVDTTTKECKVEVGTPPVAELLKKETGLEKGSGTPNTEKKANVGIEQIIKVAKIKQASMFTKTLKSAVKSVVGSAASMGILVEGKVPSEINPEIIRGDYDAMINQGVTEISEDKKKLLNKQLEDVNKRLQKEMERLKAEEEAEKAAMAAVAPVVEAAKEGEVKVEGAEAGKAAPGAKVEAGKPEAGKAAPGAKVEAGKPEAKAGAKAEKKK